MEINAENNTPWKRVFAKFAMPQSQLAAAIGRDRSKISRHLADEKGLISGADQAELLRAAKELSVDLKPEDMLPVVE